MVTIMGFVKQRKTESSGKFSLRHFELQTSVYDPSNPPSNSTEFSVICFFPNTKRWEKFPVPNIGSCVNVTTKVVGYVVKKHCLALCLLDIAYISLSSISSPVKMSSQSSASDPPTPTKGTKRPNRWSQRVGSTTPKKIRSSAPDADPITPSGSSNSTLQVAESSFHSPAVIPGDSSPNTESPAAQIDLTEARPLSLDERPQRNRRPTAKMMD